jgi:hypothetical protein
MKNIFFKLSFFGLLWYSNSELMIAAVQMSRPIFIVEKLLLVFFAFCFSGVTITAIYELQKMQRKYLALFIICICASFEVFVVYLKFNVEHDNYLLTISIFYGLFFAFITVLTFILIRLTNTPENLFGKLVNVIQSYFYAKISKYFDTSEDKQITNNNQREELVRMINIAWNKQGLARQSDKTEYNKSLEEFEYLKNKNNINL